MQKLNRPLSINEIEMVVKEFPPAPNPSPDGFIGVLCQTLKKLFHFYLFVLYGAGDQT